MKNDNIRQTPGTLRTIGVTSLIFGVLGGAFYWWVPMGIVLSMTGLLFAFVDWTNTRRHSQAFRLSIVAMLISLAALSLDIVIALLGMQTWTFGSR